MSKDNAAMLEKITNSIQHNRKIMQISSPPRSLEIDHYLGNAFGEVRASYKATRDDVLLATITAGLTILNDLTGLTISFTADSGKFTADNDYEY